MEEDRGPGRPWKRSTKRLVLVIALALVAGLRCAGDDQDSSKVCDPGDTRTCVGPGACPGGQACLPDGSGYACSPNPPREYDECDVPECTLCDVDGRFADADGVKDGYCLCLAPDASGKRVWGCAVTGSWPCPDGDGC